MLKMILAIAIGLPLGILLLVFSLAFLSGLGRDGSAPTAASASAAMPSRAEATAQAVATTTQALKIRSHSSRWSGTSMWIEGEIENTSDRPLSFVKVTATLRDAEGAFIGTATGYVDASANILQPGQTSTFKILKSAAKDAGIATYQLRPSL